MQALVPAGRAAGLVTMAEVPRPEPRPDEALVRVQAFSVNRGEIFRLENPEPPAPHGLLRTVYSARRAVAVRARAAQPAGPSAPATAIARPARASSTVSAGV